MTHEVEPSDIERWLADLPDMVVTNVERITDQHARFNFVVEEGAGLHLNVAQREAGGPVIVGTNCVLTGQALSAVREQRSRFFAEVGAVLTNAPGIYAYTDADGNAVPEDEFEAVTLRQWIYLDGLTQHELATAIIDLLNAAAYIRDTANRLAAEPDLLR